MARSRFSYIIAAACTLVLAVPILVISAVERAFVALWSWLAPAFAYTGPTPTFDGDRLAAYAGDCPVDAFTSNALRHESGMRRLT